MFPVLRGRDTALFWLSSGALIGVGGVLALVKGYVMLFVLGFSLPMFLMIIHMNAIPVLALPMVGAFLLFNRVSGGETAGEDVDPFTAVIPVKDDAAVLEGCVDSLLRHPAARVLVVYETGCRDGTGDVAEELAERERVDAVANPPETSGSKAGALNHALDLVETDVVAVFDADHRAVEESVQRALERLAGDPELTYLSGRTVKREDDLLGKVGYGESLLFHQIPSLAMDRLFGFHMVTTTNCFFRREAVDRVGGFDAAALTEDMELGVRLFLADEKIRFDPAVVSRESSARNVRDWWGQKKRWIRGSLEVCRRNHVKPLLEKPGFPALALSLTLLLLPFMYPATVLVSGFLLVNVLSGSVLPAVPLAAPGALVLYLARGDAKRGLTDGPSPYHLLSPFFLMLASFVGLKAMCEEVAGEDIGWYKVSR